MHDDFDPTPNGLVRCLQVLAAEAAYLNLRGTFGALQDAISICQEESSVSLTSLSDLSRVGPLH